jgi:hypothetical protein
MKADIGRGVVRVRLVPQADYSHAQCARSTSIKSFFRSHHHDPRGAPKGRCRSDRRRPRWTAKQTVVSKEQPQGSHFQRCRTLCSSTYSDHSGTNSRSPHLAHLTTGVSVGRKCMGRPSRLRRSEMLDSSHSDSMHGIRIFAVIKKNVEADRKGQRGH